MLSRLVSLWECFRRLSSRLTPSLPRWPDTAVVVAAVVMAATAAAAAAAVTVVVSQHLFDEFLFIVLVLTRIQ